MEWVRRGLIRCYRCGFVTYFLASCLILNTSLPPVLALEAIDMTASSGVISTTWGDHAIIQTDHGAIIDWSNFNTTSNQSVTFEQYLGGSLGSLSAVLNRVSSGAIPTQFDGALAANGRVFIVNPAGIIFGAGSTVDVAQLVASGLNMSNDAFNAVLADEANRMRFSGGGGQVQNFGQIEAQSVYLIGRKVENFGSIVAPGGLVVMAAGDSVYLGQDGSNILVRLETEPADSSPDVSNEGSVIAQNGSIILAAGDRFARAISNVGTLAAQAGTIAADAGRVTNSGPIDADAVGSDTGAISLSGSEAVVLKGGGTLTADSGHIMVEAPELILADGVTPAEPPENTVYEKWIETQSAVGTDLELVASSGTHGNIIVENITDGEITGGSGYLGLRTKYDTGSITFLPATEGDPITTRIHTTAGGGVYMVAGAGGIILGDVSTDVPSSDVEPGKIRLLTNNGGTIETGQLTVSGGCYDEVSIIASGDLTIHGNVEIITKQALRDVGQARICLVSEHRDVDIGGSVIVDTHGKNFSTADVHICAGANVRITLTPRQRIEASAHTLETGPAQASVAIHAGKDIEGPGVISIVGGGRSAVHVYAQVGRGRGAAEVYWSDDPSTWDETNGDAHAVLNINVDRTAACPDCPEAPDLQPVVPPMSLPDEQTTHMGSPISGNVLDNDTPPDGKTLTVFLVDEPQHGTLIQFDWETGAFTYEPDEGFVGMDTFTYIATDGEFYTEPVTVTVAVTNTLPIPGNDAETTNRNVAIVIDVLANDLDPDGDQLKVASFTYTGAGTLVLNKDGTFTYTPTKGFVGEDSFTYSAIDGQVGAEPIRATVTIAVMRK